MIDLVEHYVAIDLGAESARLILGALENEVLSYRVVHRFATKGTYLFDTFRWNVLRFWEEIIWGLGKISKMQEVNIKGISVDSWGANLIFLTEDNELAGQPFHYRDSLTEVGNKRMREILDMDRVFEITGLQEMLFNGPVHISGMMVEHPSILERTKKIMMIPDYINFLLTGKLTTEYTNATTSQLFDATDKHWSNEILKQFNLDSSYFPKLNQPGDLIGKLNKTTQEATGLGDIPVYSAPSHDTASAVVGIPVENENCAYLSSGTWSLLGVEIPSPIINENVKNFNFTNEGGAFGTIRLLKNIMGLWLLQKCKEIWDKDTTINDEHLSYEQITKEAEEIGTFGSHVKVDESIFYNPDSMIEAIQKRCESTEQKKPKSRGEIARCIFESLANRYKEVLDMIKILTGFEIETLHIVGGGSKNDLLNQITADTIGIKVEAGPVEATAAGNIMVQAYANGTVKSLKEIRKIIRKSFDISTFIPSK